MSIEIKQLQIKSSVVQRCAEDADGDADRSEQAQSLKEEILAECKSLIHEVLSELQER